MQSSCKVELISVGNELLLGNTVNSNASWIASQVTSLGGSVARMTTVADNLDEISHAIKEAIQRRPTFIITTGGLGPTFDDMTLRGVAKALRVSVRLDRTAATLIQEHYTRRLPNRRVRMTKSRLKMASIPSGGEAIRNPIGTAPAVRLSVGKIELFCLPGVPREAKAIFKDSIAEVISSRTGGLVFVERWVNVRGIMESTLAPMINQVMRRWPDVYIKSHPRGVEAGGRPHIELHFSTHGSDAGKAKGILLLAVRNLVDRLIEVDAKIGPVSRDV
jgi:nicotinamide-nucleotide amidase